MARASERARTNESGVTMRMSTLGKIDIAMACVVIVGCLVARSRAIANGAGSGTEDRGNWGRNPPITNVSSTSNAAGRTAAQQARMDRRRAL